MNCKEAPRSKKEAENERANEGVEGVSASRNNQVSGGKKKREALGSLSSPLRQALFCEESEFLRASGDCGFGQRLSEGC